jgi:hypothetical protein
MRSIGSKESLANHPLVVVLFGPTLVLAIHGLSIPDAGVSPSDYKLGSTAGGQLPVLDA